MGVFVHRWFIKDLSPQKIKVHQSEYTKQNCSNAVHDVKMQSPSDKQ